MQNGFVLCLVVRGVREAHAEDVVHLVPLRRYKDHSCSCPRDPLGPIDEYGPTIRQAWEFGYLSFRPFGYEIW
jgi:hypothetical protein